MFQTNADVQKRIDSNSEIENNFIKMFNVEALLESVFTNSPSNKGLANALRMLGYAHTSIVDFDVCNREHIIKLSETSPVGENRQTIMQMIAEMKEDYFAGLDQGPKIINFDSHFGENLLKKVNADILRQLLSGIYNEDNHIKKAFTAFFEKNKILTVPFSNKEDLKNDYSEIIKKLEIEGSSSYSALATKLKIEQTEFMSII